MFNTPILFLIFNRPDKTKLVFNSIKQIKPKKLFIAADGPRTFNNSDVILCNETRSILNEIDWECQVYTLLRQHNLGCGKAVSEAITWFFDNVEEGIILEDDCLPNISFYNYCEHLLARYRNSYQIMHIGGNNFQFGKIIGNGDYYYSKLGHIWGWATWKRAWSKYDFKIDTLSENYLKNIKKAFIKKELIVYFTKVFNEVSEGKIDTWDYQWLYCLIINNGISICPNVNLVKNIGFGAYATHTTSEVYWNEINFANTITNFNQPKIIEVNYNADLKTLKVLGIYKEKKLLQDFNHKIINTFLRLFKYYKNNLKSTLGKSIDNTTSWREIEYFDEAWKLRINMMSSYIIENTSVVDLGCGPMWLSNLLGDRNTYFGVDYVKRDDKTIVCDFNKYEFPCIYADYYFISGCLEYVNDVEWFIESISKYTSRIIISYCILENFPDLHLRKSYAWVNNFTQKNLLDLFLSEKYELINIQETPSRNIIFYLEKSDNFRV